jgi:hypothetical protein
LFFEFLRFLESRISQSVNQSRQQNREIAKL